MQFPNFCFRVVFVVVFNAVLYHLLLDYYDFGLVRTYSGERKGELIF